LPFALNKNGNRNACQLRALERIFIVATETLTDFGLDNFAPSGTLEAPAEEDL